MSLRRLAARRRRDARSAAVAAEPARLRALRRGVSHMVHASLAAGFNSWRAAVAEIPTMGAAVAACFTHASSAARSIRGC